MNIAHDHNTCMKGAAPVAADGGFAHVLAPLDWMELRARLFASHEVRSVLSAEETTAAGLRLRGSFDGCAASLLTTYEGFSTPVNPTVSTNRKSGRAIVLPGAGESRTGERG